MSHKGVNEYHIGLGMFSSFFFIFILFYFILYFAFLFFGINVGFFFL